MSRLTSRPAHRPAGRAARRLAVAAALVVAAGVLPAFAVGTAGAAAPVGKAAADDTLFAPAPRFTPGGAKVRVAPERYAATAVDLAAVRGRLAGAPGARSATALELDVPTPDGGTERFAVQRTTVMEPKLAAAHPEITTYSGRSLENPGTTIALDVTPMGFHASVRGAQGQQAWFVDPAYNRRGTTTHLSYYGGSVPDTAAGFVEREAPELGRASARAAAPTAAAGGPVTQRVYRLALTSDPTYASYFGSANVLSEKATLINRVNQIYNDDMAIKMVLVDATDSLNLDTKAKATGPNGPCGAHACFDAATPTSDSQLAYCDVPGLDRNRIVLGQLVGASNYDVGHLALGVNGGGIAFLGVVGQDFKAAGCTGLPEPRGDFFAIDYVAHELGHQFGGNHTFDGVQNACSGGNRNGETSVEPGSGSSVMAYAGICLQDDLQPHTDPYFSQRTIDEVSTYARSEAGPVVEVQTVSLRGFDASGESITLGYQAETPITLTRGVDYDAAGIEAAVETLTGTDVLVAGWGYDPYGGFSGFPAPLTSPNGTGFQVIFATSPRPNTAKSDHLDMAPLTVTSTSAGVSGTVGETARGGLAGNAGDQVIETGNSAPVVKAPRNRTIPLRTPFTLTGSGSDPDGDPLTYLWEQNDTGGSRGTGLVDNSKVDGPLFRVFGTFAGVTAAGTLESPSPGLNQAGRKPTRTFPDLRQVLNGNTNAANGRCRSIPDGARVGRKALNCFSEFLPTKGYVGTAGSSTPAMHFRLTARDGYADGGGTGHDDVRLKISQKRGPFLVTSQANGKTLRGGRKSVVRWDVNRTRKLAKKVRIMLSTDGGKHWSKLAKTSNDGKRKLRIPRDSTRHARIMIEAVDNYFFAVNDKEFRIR